MKDCVDRNFQNTIVMKDAESGFIHPAYNPHTMMCDVTVTDIDLEPLPFWKMLWRTIVQKLERVE